ncbi:MAG TPA: RHS repeat-associated core domain-containing protein [Gemmatimonadaceae bacterium]
MTITPGSGTDTVTTLSVTIAFCDNVSLMTGTKHVIYDGVDVSANFPYQVKTVAGCGAAGQATGTVSLHSGKSDTLSATIEDNALNSGSATVIYTYTPPPPPAAVSIGPDGFPVSAPINSVGLTDTFTVKNSGGKSGSITLSTTSCIAPASNCSAPNPTSVTLAPNQAARVTIAFNTNATPATGGIIKLHGTVGSSQDDGTTTLATYVDPPLQNPASVGPGSERDVCLSFSVSAGAATECGDLRLVVSLPPVQSLGKTREPALLYNSQFAHPFPLVATNVTAPSGSPLPTTVKATLLVNGVVRDSGSWNGSDWGTPGSTRQITLGYDALSDSTNVYPYTMQVVAITSGVQDTLEALTGQLVVVNRSQSPFGAGWWLAGLDQLIAQPGGAFLFVGGDGTTRIYTPVPGQPTEWTAPQIDHRDLLQLIGSEYVQMLPHGLTVHFNSAGQHTATVNRLGEQTTFAYDATCHQLSSITTPIGGLAYTFAYSTFGTPPCGDRRLATVTAPPIGSQTRVVTLTPLSNGQVSEFLNVDGSTVHFGYDATWPTRILSRTNELGKVVTFAYDASDKVSQVSRAMDSAAAIVTNYTNAPVRGFRGTAAIDTAQVYTEVNGPRTDTTITKFWLDRFGAPRRIENALGQYTTLTRGDVRWPSLVTRLVAINGLVTTAGYDDHGNVLADTVWNPLGNGQNAVSTYQWDRKWDFVTLTTTPTGQQTQFAYDGVTGNTVYSMFGGDTTSFTYTSSGLLQTVTTSDQAHDSYSYDALGNLATHTPPLGSTTTIARDAIGRDTLTLTPSTASDTLHVRTLYDRVGADTLARSWGLGDTLVVRTRYDAADEDTSVTQHAYPDRNHLGDVVRSFTYDALGRKIKERLHGAEVLSWEWDAAGNLLIGGHDDAGAHITYDALNRPIEREGWYTNSTFHYDSSGNLTLAHGSYGTTARTYYPNGLVATDTQTIATAADTGDFSQHVYVIGYQYDVGGRRTALTMPTQLGGGQVSYSYDPRTGQLATITDPGGIRFRYHYDRQARLDTLVRRDGLSDAVREVRAYDLASRVATRRVWTPTATMLADTIVYDVQGRATSIGTEHGRDTVAYDALGWTTASRVMAKQSYFTLDAMQNREVATLAQDHGFSTPALWYETGTGRLLGQATAGSPDAIADSTFDDYDGFGNLHSALHQIYYEPWTDPGNGYNDWMYLRYQISDSYDESNRLVSYQMVYDTVAQFYREQQLQPYSASETYRYDALGRRVWYRSIKGAQCTYVEASSGCHSTLTRVIWDGAQILGEIRADGSAGASPGELEDDAPTYMGANYGKVAYVHGLALDTPLEVVKNQDYVVLPVADYRGAMVTGTCPALPCQTTQLVFPESSEGLFGDLLHSSGWPSWYGTLIEGQTDASGYMYRRNRYLDPASGRFTQEDPIGLAGGLNAYGYANGDPVDFSDPFGLIPDGCDPPGSCQSMGLVIGTTVGAATGVALTTVCASVTFGLCALAGPELTTGLAAFGATAGLAIAGRLESRRSANDIPLVGGPPNTTVTKPGQAVRYGPNGNVTTRTCARAGHDAMVHTRTST